MERFLNRNSIFWELKLPHEHIYSQKNNQAYPQAFILLEEEIQIELVEEPSKQENLTVGVITATKYSLCRWTEALFTQ